MTDHDKLIVSQLTKQNEAMIERIKNNNGKLGQYRNAIMHIVLNNGRDGLQGEAFREEKKQLVDYLYIIDSMRIINSYHVQECNRLNQLVGEEDLIGNVILGYMDELEKQYDSLLKKQNYLTSEHGSKFYVALGGKDYYELILKQTEEEIENNRAEYRIWSKKAEKFDEISSSTSEMFNDITNNRNMMNRSLGVVQSQFVNGRYQNKLDESWKDRIESALVKCVGKGKVELKTPFPIFIDNEDGKEYYGASQTWMFDYLGVGSLLVGTGCSLISLQNIDVFWSNEESLTVREYTARVRQYVNDNRPLYNAYFAEQDSIPASIEGCDRDVHFYIDKMAREHGYKGASWCKFDLDVIRDQIAHDIPVIYCVAKGHEETGKHIYLYKKVGDAQFKQVEYLETDKYLERMTGLPEGTKEYNPELSLHTVTITGVDESINVGTGEVKSMIKISTWGEEYYISYDQAVEFNEAHKEFIHEDSGMTYESRGLGGISKVEY